MALVSYLVIPVYGWRAAFFIGAVPAIFAAVLRFAVPESPRYLELRGRHSEADALVAKMEAEARAGEGKLAAESPSQAGETEALAVETEPQTLAAKAEAPKPEPQSQTHIEPHSGVVATLGKLFGRRHLRATICLWVLWFAINLGYYGFVLWTPSLLQAQGYDMVRSFEFTLLMCVAQLPGYLAAALLIERLGRKKVLVAFLLGTAASAWLFGQATSVEQILVFGCMLYFFALGAWGCVYSYTPELYPTEIRGSGNGWAAAFGRVGALLGPLIVPWLYTAFGEQQGFVYVFVILTAVFVIAAIVVGLLGRETRGVTLQER
jgi:putative MFS transporter